MRAVAPSLTQLSKPSAHYIYTRQVTSSQATEDRAHTNVIMQAEWKCGGCETLSTSKLLLYAPCTCRKIRTVCAASMGPKFKFAKKRTNVKCRTLAGCGGRNAELEPLNHVTVSKVRVASHVPPSFIPFSSLQSSLPFPSLLASSNMHSRHEHANTTIRRTVKSANAGVAGLNPR